jgi:GMP synthase (glutamine-hydrolysing)
MKILLIDNGSTLLERLKVLIPGSEIVRRFDDLGNEYIDKYDLIVLSGGSLFELSNNEDKFSREINLVKNYKKPIIGICFGFEIIVTAFGGKLKKLEQKQTGLKEIDILDKDFYNKSQIIVSENHQWGVDILPGVFEVLAKSESGPEIIKHRSLPIYGFQFHPENMLDKSDGDELFLKILKSNLADKNGK